MPKWFRMSQFQGLALLIHDVLAIYVAIGIAHTLRLGSWFADVPWPLIAIIVVTVIVLYVMNVYHLDRHSKPVRTAVRTFAGVAAGGALIASLIYLTRATTYDTVLWRGIFSFGMLIFAVWAATIRYLIHAVISRYAQETSWLVLGSGERANTLGEDHRKSWVGGELEFIAGSEDQLDSLEVGGDDKAVVVRRAGEEIFSDHVGGVILATSGKLPESLVSNLMRVRLRGVPIIELHDFYEEYLLRVPVMQLQDGWFALSEGFALLHHDVQLKLKRVIDVLVAAVGLVVASPVFVIVALAVRFSSRGSIFYNQVRAGHDGEEFRLHKFRTMVEDAELDGPQWTTPGDPRITFVGGFLRRSRLDELPQLWNVLIGDMSFIGPRPERPDFNRELEQQIPYYDFRHLIKPGITGWAQVMYPYGASVEDAKNKLEFDLYYIKNYSLALDFYIVLRTIRVLVSHSGR